MVVIVIQRRDLDDAADRYGNQDADPEQQDLLLQPAVKAVEHGPSLRPCLLGGGQRGRRFQRLVLYPEHRL